MRGTKFVVAAVALAALFGSSTPSLASAAGPSRMLATPYSLPPRNPDVAAATHTYVDGPNGYKVWRMRKPATNDPEELAKRKAQQQSSN